MGKIGYGYGSEWHLLRYLGYHREYFSQKTLGVTGGDSIEWLDFNFSKENVPLRHDREFLGLEFIKDERVQDKWTSFWPRSGNSQNWDALGKIHCKLGDEWLLVETKGHLGEIKSNCRATRPGSVQKITRALENTSAAFGNRIQPVGNWLQNYYQYANRLAVLHFLTNICVPAVDARLLFVYFCGEIRDDAECPKNKQEWEPAIGEMNQWLGIDESCELSKRVHHLFIPVNPITDGNA